MPLSFTWFLLLAAVLLLWFNSYRNLAKWLATGSLLSLYLFSFFPVSHFLLEPIEKTYPPYQAGNKNVPYVWVLGHYSKADKSVPLSSQLSDSTIIRLVEGIRIYRLNKGSQLIFSGWNKVEEGSHPMRVRQMAILLGVPEKDILVVAGQKDTVEEAESAKKLLGDYQLVNKHQLVLVTSASHIKRAMYLFEKEGLKPIAAPTDFQVKEFTGITALGFFPSAHALVKMESAVYEYLGMLWVWLVN